MMKSFVESAHNRILVCDGAMGTMIYTSGVYINQCFENLNLSKPDLIEKIHKEYILAGADIIETNTFGANRLKLTPHGLGEQTSDINAAGVKIAKKAAGKDVFVAGSIGPLGKLLEPMGPVPPQEAQQIYIEQATALIENGVDLIILETFSHLPTLKIAVSGVRKVSSDIPILAQMTLSENLEIFTGEKPEQTVVELSALPVQAVGFNCSVGPADMLEAVRMARPATNLPLSAQPNAGAPQKVEGRCIYLATPEYMAEFAKRMIQTGVNIVGSCCGSTPAHTRAIRAAVRALVPSRIVEQVRVEEKPEKAQARPELPSPSVFARKIAEKKFVVSVELDPPAGTDPAGIVESAKKLRKANVDAVNIADGPRATARMNPTALALLIREDSGMETIVHYCCRDRNLLGMQSDLIGANALGLYNILIVTGDPPKMGDYPFATAVFDVDSIGLTKIARNLNTGLDLAGNPIKGQTSLFIGVGANPGALDIDEEVRRFEKKVENGARYALTQPVYEVRLLENFLKRIEPFRIPLLVGILPLSSYRNAEFLHNEVPGMQIPEAIRERMRRADTKEAARMEGINIARESLREAKPMVDGVYIMPPFGRIDAALQTLEI
ncbi:MAG TPA: bifunctional homocysteine S-methyltransferase/methylenetetrahydrofolate reductase [Candidatus Sumerlaeota bacterium]|nr:MAG: Bifunctional homocysteine S-methyltransferase/5,10-methylenetetrahydrofolate reductase [candidate division BRC1 bacterium ADurb.Bin183]HOE62961.1 bifunctional homocysteine S-methyltransferase/methylenetetrahydrofolate reductase [Candidatus Sumerlaeota bacterium]HRR31758.1 bifunctional homocysteine S-methyltransferase/methylenetetrahydrofolate reductase [Candidatus Sumerlaeia bacterium]HON49610.1 bifunctional homocysteine S-methyltransferase/methylenetetrahydrofolate reductase [Candidatus